jgi:hypothetical protein
MISNRLPWPARADKSLADNSKTAAASRIYQARPAIFLLHQQSRALLDAQLAKGNRYVRRASGRGVLASQG